MLIVVVHTRLQPLPHVVSAEAPLSGVPAWVNEFIFSLPLSRTLVDVFQAALDMQVPMYVSGVASCCGLESLCSVVMHELTIDARRAVFVVCVIYCRTQVARGSRCPHQLRDP